jgi:hypothetical protein
MEQRWGYIDRENPKVSVKKPEGLGQKTEGLGQKRKGSDKNPKVSDKTPKGSDKNRKDSDKTPKVSDINLFQCHFIHHKSHIECPRSENRLSLLEAGD